MFGSSARRSFSDQHMDLLGRLKVSRHQNVYDADFEYGSQPLRWESLTVGGGAVVHQPGQGGVRLSVGTASGDLACRQTRPYHRYQPGKAMSMASAILLDPAVANNRQRVGFFDDGNGMFFEQADPNPANGNPSGVFCVVRSDVGGTPNDFIRVPMHQWNGDAKTIRELDWSRLQMVWMEYAWYGAGSLRWGVFINGEPITLHQISFGNRASQTVPWCRTGNLPVRYETRNLAGTTQGSVFLHYGVSVLVEGGVDEQRGFTYSYGMAPTQPRRLVAAASTRFPVLSIRPRTMGTIEFTQANAAATAGTTTTLTVTGTPWTVNQWAGRQVFFPGLGGGNGLTARIISNTASVLTFGDVVTGAPLATAPGAAANYQIGLINRGQLLPRRLMLSSDQLCIVELIASTPTSPVALTNPTWTALSALGSANSFAERDVAATGSATGGEVVFAFTAPAGGSGLQDIPIDQLFPLYNNIRGNTPDILALVVTTQGAQAANVGAHLIAQEAMS